ncbi:MAG: hypothetical protein Q9187_008173, partial [Circinaria calcarea]
GPPPFSTSTLTSPIFTSTLPLPRTASDSVLPTRRISTKRQQQLMARRQKRTRSAASSIASQSSSESDRDDIDGFSMGDFSIDLARFGGSFVNGVKGAVNESAITVPKREKDAVESEDEGPTDFTMHLEEYMRGAKTWKMKGKGKELEGESKHDDEMIREVGDQEEKIEEKEHKFEGVFSQEGESISPDDMENSVIHREQGPNTPPISRLNAEALQDKAAQEVFSQISALQAEVERLRLEAEDHRAEKLALEEDHLRLTDQNEDMAFEIHAADQAIAALEAQNRARAEEWESKMEKNRENATRFGSLRSKFEPLAQELDAVRKEAEAAKEDAGAARKEVELGKKDSELTRKELETTRKEMEAAGNEAEAVRKDIDAALKKMEVAKMETDIARKETDAARKEREAAREETEALKQELETSKRETVTANEAAEAARRETEVARQETEAARQEIEDTKVEAKAVRVEMKRTKEQLEVTKQDTSAKIVDFTEQLKHSQEQLATAVAERKEIVTLYHQAATKYDSLQSELFQCKQDLSGQLEASQARDCEFRSQIKNLEARLRTADEPTSHINILRTELEHTQEQLSETQRLLETVGEENDRFTQQNKRQLEETESMKSELIATRRSASEYQEKIAETEGEIEKIQGEIEKLHVQKEATNSKISELTEELDRVKELRQGELEAARADLGSGDNESEDNRLADQLDRVSAHYETELDNLRSNYEAEMKKLKSTLHAAEGMKKHEDGLVKAHADALSSLETKIETLEKEKPGLASPTVPSTEISALTSTLSTTRASLLLAQQELAQTRTALLTTQTALQQSQQLLESQQADHEAVNKALEARFSEVMEKREKEWRRRIGVLLREREKMGKALMWAWGKEE